MHALRFQHAVDFRKDIASTMLNQGKLGLLLSTLETMGYASRWPI